MSNATKNPPRILGTGLLCLDIIKQDNIVRYYPGGSCGNIISSLAFLGWDSAVLSWKNSDIASEIINYDLNQVGVKQIYFNKSNSLTPRIIENLTIQKNKYISHDFLLHCPDCSNKLPKLHVPQVKDINDLNISYSDYDVLFSDRTSPGIQHLQSIFKRNKKWIVYEPNSSRNQSALIANSLKSNIVKFSLEKVSTQLAETLRELAADSDILLIVQTMGSRGLRFSYRMRNNKISNWINLPSQPTSKIIDTVGAGDWCTTGLLFSLISRSRVCRNWFNKDELIAALQFGQALAAISCSFIGAQGILYADKSHENKSLLRDLRKFKKNKLNTFALSMEKTISLCQTCLLPL